MSKDIKYEVRPLDPSLEGPEAATNAEPQGKDRETKAVKKTFSLSPDLVEMIDLTSGRKSLSRTEVLRRAVQLYEWLDKNYQIGGDIRFFDATGKQVDIPSKLDMYFS